jgi:hypothetical protein
MEQMTPGYPVLHWRGPLPVTPMPTVPQLAKRIANTETALRRANGRVCRVTGERSGSVPRNAHEGAGTHCREHTMQRLDVTEAMALTRMLHSLGWDTVMRYDPALVGWTVTVKGKRNAT